jgi:hypothetical protein
MGFQWDDVMMNSWDLPWMSMALFSHGYVKLLKGKTSAFA